MVMPGTNPFPDVIPICVSHQLVFAMSINTAMSYIYQTQQAERKLSQPCVFLLKVANELLHSNGRNKSQRIKSFMSVIRNSCLNL
jgi:hypothetical protein